MNARNLSALLSLLVATSALAEGPSLDLYERWDIRGHYFATGQTLTVKEGSYNIATELLGSNTLEIVPDEVAFPPGAKLLAALLYWSGARETPDDKATITVPGGVPTSVTADKCAVLRRYGQ